MTPVSPPEVNWPKDDAREIGWSSLATHSAVQSSPCPEGAAGGSGERVSTAPGTPATTGPDRAAAGPGAPKSARQTASVASLRPTAGWYRPDVHRPWADGASHGPPGPRGTADTRELHQPPPRDTSAPSARKLADSAENRHWFPRKLRI